MSDDVFVFPTSFAQEVLWLLDRATPGLSAYNAGRAVRLQGALDASALRRALDALMERHEILRTTYGERDGQPVQLVAARRSVPLVERDLRDLAPDVREAEAMRLVEAEVQAPFDLTRDALLRALLVRVADAEHVLVLTTHHIASDGWSGGIMLRELAAAYAAFRRGAAPELAPLPLQYADYASWQHEHFQGERLDEVLAYWRKQLAGAQRTLELPTDRPRPVVQSFDGDRRSLTLPAELASGIRALAQAQGVTVYQTLLAAYQTLLHRYSGQADVVVGSPTAGRDRPETESVIGYFANTLVLRTSFADDPTFAQLLARVRETCLGAYEHQEVPFEKLVLELRDDGQLSHTPLFQVVFTMLDSEPARFALDDLAASPVRLDHGTTKFDLTLFGADRANGMGLTLFYRTDLFDGGTIDRLLGHLQTLLAAAVANPDTRVSVLPLLTDAERGTLGSWNASDRPLHSTADVAARIAAHAAARGTHPAVTDGTVTLTYAELDRRANQLAQRLARLGVGPDDAVGLCVDRGAEAIVGVLGIWKAGGAYVTLLPDLPAARLATQVRESVVRVVVTQARHLERIPAGATTVALDRDAAELAAEAATVPAVAARAGRTAYILFTSGSTGTPKGVAVSHGNLAHYVDAIAPVLGLAPGSASDWHFATVSTLGADLGHTTVFPALAHGGTLHVLPHAVATEPARFGEYSQTHPIDVLKITPSHLKALLSGPHGAAALPRQVLVLGGEALSWELADELVAAKRCRVINHYGPTETTVGVCTFDLAAAASVRNGSPKPATVPIGRPLARMHLHVLDPQQQPVPVGVPGELWIGGVGVSPGYVGRPELTAERFQTLNRERCYRTGDRVRRLASGALEFLGRLDQQVKLRGYRVELGEIEAVLEQHPGVRQAAVVYREGSGLTAYVVRVTSAGASDASLRQLCAERLPDYMVPAHFVTIDALPLNPNGKLDRKAVAALPVPDTGDNASAADAPAAAPVGETEEGVAKIWAEVLKRDAVGRHDNFLDLGGHSLLAIRVLGRLSKAFGVRLALRALFDAPTVAQLAATIETQRAVPAVTAAPASGIAAVSRDGFRRTRPAQAE